MSRRRLIHTVIHTSKSGTVHTAKVYRCTEWNEWVVKFSVDNHMLQKSDYHATDKHDAVCTANYHIQRISQQFA